LFPENVEAEDILYLSPEQIQHIPISASSDIYSLGVTLFTLLTGKLPYSEDFPDIDEMRLRILNDPLPFVDFATVKMNGIIQAATAKNSNERFANFESMLLEIGGELNVKQSTLFSTTKRILKVSCQRIIYLSLSLTRSLNPLRIISITPMCYPWSCPLIVQKMMR
jgi:serine/threonine protein kinase